MLCLWSSTSIRSLLQQTTPRGELLLQAEMQAVNEAAADERHDSDQDSNNSYLPGARQALEAQGVAGCCYGGWHSPGNPGCSFWGLKGQTVSLPPSLPTHR